MKHLRPLLFAAFSFWMCRAIAEPRTYFELRLYTVTSNKMDGVLERFQDTVDPVRHRHGIGTLGYWSSAGTTNGGTFAYIMTAETREELQRREKEFGKDPDFQKGYAASSAKHGKSVEKIDTVPLSVDPKAKFDFKAANPARVFELRIYSILPGKIEVFRNRWRDFAVPIYGRHGLHSVGWWIAETKDAEGHDQFICLLAGTSDASIQKSIREFHQDAEWIRVEQETEANGKLRSGVAAYRLTPTDFSALK